MIKNKKIFNLKNLIFVAIAVILAGLFYGGHIFYIQAGKINNYKITSNEDFQINEIWINGNKRELQDIALENNLNYDPDLDAIITNKLEYRLTSVYELNFIFKTAPERESIELYNNNKKRVINLDSEKESILTVSANNCSISNIIKTYFKTNNIFIDMVILVVAIVVYFLLLNLIFKIINNIKNNNIKFRDIVLYFVSNFIILITAMYFALEISAVIFELSIATLLLAGLFYIKDGIKNNIHNLFLYLMIPLSLVFVLALPLNHVPDECSHFYKSYRYAYKLLGKDVDQDNDYCFYTDRSLENVTSEYTLDVFDGDLKMYPRIFFNQMNINYEKNNSTYNACWGSVVYQPFVAYILLIFSIVISQILHLPPMCYFILGRMLNLFAYLLAGYYSIKYIKKHKFLVFIISTLPIAVQEAGAYSQDSIHNAVFLILFMLIINAINEKSEMTKKEFFVLLGTSIIFGLCKLGYFPVMWLCFLIPSKRFKSKKHEIISKVILAGTIFVIFAICYFTKVYSPVPSGNEVDYYTINSFFTNPLEMIKLYFNTLKTNGVYFYFQGLMDGFGYSVKYNSNTIKLLLTMLYTFLFIIIPKDSESIKNKIAYLIVGLAISFLITLSMLSLTKIGYELLEGLQARYFLPVVLILLPILNFKFIQNKAKNNNLIIGQIMIIVYLFIFVTVIQGYYF